MIFLRGGAAVHRVNNMFHFTQVPAVYALVTKFKMVAHLLLWITQNRRLHARKLVNGTCISTRKFQQENGTTFSKVHLFPGIFQWNAHKMCVPLTSQLKFPEFLDIKIKWKVPIVLLHLFLLQIQMVQLPQKPLLCICGLWIQTLDLPPPPPHHRGNKENSSPWSFAS